MGVIPGRGLPGQFQGGGDSGRGLPGQFQGGGDSGQGLTWTVSGRA